MARAVTAILDDQDLTRWAALRVTSSFTGLVTSSQTVTVHRSDPQPVSNGSMHVDFRSTRTAGRPSSTAPCSYAGDD